MDIQVTEILRSLSWIEWMAVLTGLIYVILAARSDIRCWAFGIISCALWSYATFTFYNLYADAFLQLFYVVMGILGWISWAKGGPDKTERPITRLDQNWHLIIIGSGALVAFLVGFLLKEHTQAAATYLDSWTTVMAVWATFLAIGRKLENWLYWIVVDALYVYLYLDNAAYLFALLYVIYTVIAAVGYRTWKRKLGEF